jgi:GxxExxY protein
MTPRRHAARNRKSRGGRLVVELKAVESLAPVHTAQVLAYLEASRLTLGLLLNFNVRRLAMGVRRVILSQPLP